MTVRTLPASAAVVDAMPREAAAIVRRLQAAGCEAARFDDADVFLTTGDPYRFGGYVLAHGVPGIETTHLVRLVRRRSAAPLLVVADAQPPVRLLEALLDEGADAVLQRPVAASGVEAALAALQRRVAVPRREAWQLDAAQSCVRAPNGATVPVNATDLALLGAFADAGGTPVARGELAALLRDAADATAANVDGALHAAMYRLRRRLEQGTGLMVPLKAMAGVGYLFLAELQWT